MASSRAAVARGAWLWLRLAVSRRCCLNYVAWYGERSDWRGMRSFVRVTLLELEQKAVRIEVLFSLYTLTNRT